MDTKEIEEAVIDILNHARVDYKARYIGETKNALGGKVAMDRWECTFYSHPRDFVESFDFYTGLGLRSAPKWGYGISVYDGSHLPPRPGTLLHKQWMELAKPVAPHPADVLYSLIRDSEAVGMSFANWCSELGYDSDSRKAYATYEECQCNADKLHKVFQKNDITALETALQDY